MYATIKQLKKAVTVIKEECKSRPTCNKCPLYKNVCHQLMNPEYWSVDKIGVEDDET